MMRRCFREPFLRFSLLAMFLLLVLAGIPVEKVYAATVEEVSAAIKKDLKTKDNARYCFDMAGILSDETEETLVSSGRELYEDGNGQLLLVTVENIDGAEQAAFATELFNRLGLGAAEADDGVLILLIREGNHCQIATGDGIADVLTDRRCGSILDSFCVPYMEKGDYDSAAQLTYDSSRSNLQDREKDTSDDDGDDGPMDAVWSILGVVFVIWLSFLPLAFIFWILDKIVRLFILIFQKEWPEKTKLSEIAGFLAMAVFIPLLFLGGNTSSSDGGFSSGGGGSSSGGGAGR